MDRTLVERARGGDVEAYEALGRGSTRRLYLTAFRVIDAIREVLAAR